MGRSWRRGGGGKKGTLFVKERGLGVLGKYRRNTGEKKDKRKRKWGVKEAIVGRKKIKSSRMITLGIDKGEPCPN